MDDYIAKILADLEDAGVREETLVVVTADHGENLGELNVYGDHQTADHRTCRVPLIVDGPGVESGEDDALYYNVDFGPTMVAFLAREDEEFGEVGLFGSGSDDSEDGEDVDPADAVPDDWDGESFAGSLTGDDDGDAAGREFLVLSQGAWACQRAVRWDEYLLIRTYHDGLKQFEIRRPEDAAKRFEALNDKLGWLRLNIFASVKCGQRVLQVASIRARADVDVECSGHGLCYLGGAARLH